MSRTILCFLFATGLIYAHSLKAQQSSIEEFNKTFPPSAEVASALERVDAIIPAEDNYLKLFKNRYESKLEIRVLTCVKFVSKEEIDPKKIAALTVLRNNCLEEQDEQLLQLIGISLVSFRSMQPPLRPMVKLGSPSFIPNSEGMQVFTGIAASKSGVAVLRYTRGEYVSYEIPSGKQIAHLPVMPNASDHTAVLSPNGRMIVIRNGGLLSFVDNETGQVLWGARKFGDFYAWFPEMQAALVNRTINGESKLWLLDFKTGEIAPYSIPYNGQTWALQISESPSRFLIGSRSHEDFSLVENIRISTGVVGKIVKDYKLVNSRITYDNPILMENGKSIFFRSFLEPKNDFFTLFNLNSGKEKQFDTGGFLNKNNYAKLSEEALLVTSHDGIGYSTNNLPNPWVFNLNNLTLSPIEADEFWGIVSPLDGRKGFMRRVHKGMWIGDEVKIGKPLSLESVLVTDRVKKELTELEKKADYKNDKQGSLAGFETQIAEKRAGLIGNIPSNAQVQAIGVYQGKHDGTNRIVNVTVKKTRNPIVLMLSSYESLSWNLAIEPSAKLIAVIVTSYEGSKITGAGNTKVIVRRGNYANWAFEKNTPEYTTLNNDAFLWAGRPISKFQGEYEGDTFSVGD